MDLIQYNRQDFFNIKEKYQTSEETYDNYEEILNIINTQLFQNNKYPGNKSTKDWRKKKLPSFLDRTISEEDKLKNSINLELNKLSVENYKSIFSIIKKILNEIPTEKYDEIITLIVDNVFEKAVVQPNYCLFYVKLLLSLVNPDNKTLIMTLLRNKCTIYHQILTKKIDRNDQVKDISNNEDIEDPTEYDEMCKEIYRKQYKRGFSQFVAELYNFDIITTREILFFSQKMLSNILDGLMEENVDADFIEDNIIYFQKLIEVSVDRLMDRQRKNTNPIFQIMQNIENGINHKHIGKIQGRLKFKLKDCHDILKHHMKNEHKPQR